MKLILNCLIVLLTLICTASCSKTLIKPEWTFEKAAVKIRLRADNKLNLYNNNAHTLYVCFYQLASLNTFDQMTADPSGIRQLLNCRLFDESVAAASSKVIHAGEDLVLTLDRAERAQYVALVAGYSDTLTNERAVRRFTCQVHHVRKNLFKKEYQCKPCPMIADVALGPTQIEYSKILPVEGLKCSDECER
ncbi:MAG: hypothetical protein HKP58_18505 [Desulfatitalea sp.]|nr:type VI secretion lipoprotein TssJ [Desulfatitalea sp.]NNK02409.1 hypothetical protein [Desulfatitalea sp.]